METLAMVSPFPGLRPFEPDEDYLFFGREKEIDDLLRRLRQTRFLPVVGASGSGKSSLVRSGLIPSLHSGFMVKAGSTWRVAILRPGEDPIGNLASALNAPDVLGGGKEMGATNRVLLEATLRRSTSGLREAVRNARMPTGSNLLVFVDQFEEIFRFQRGRESKISSDDAAVFVSVLLEASRHPDPSIYVVFTMRSDFIEDCLEHPGLAEAINAGQYLVPRMTRDELRSAITGPVAVAGGAIAARLVLRLLNDVGEDPDQLPVLQHALMRTWDYWQSHRETGEAIDIRHYEAIGTMRRALSLHADEAYDETGGEHQKDITRRIFKALTDTSTDSRGVRRPTAIQDLAVVCGCSEEEVAAIVDIFRRPGRSFLMPPWDVPLDSNSIVDLSHESLMRCWTRLIEWAEEERVSAASYARVAQAAAWHEEKVAGLWRDPELELGLEWRKKNHPTAAWAQRYNPSFDRAMRFLDKSEDERDELRAVQEQERKRKLTYAWTVCGILAVLLAVALTLGWIAARERSRAEANLQLAKSAVDEMLSSAGGDAARVAADVPQMEEFRGELLRKARDFYSQFSNQTSDREEFRQEMALAHVRLGDIHRLLQETDPAVEEYQKAIELFDALIKDFPNNPDHRRLLGNTYNWLGETQRVANERRSEAERAYTAALELQTALHSAFPERAELRQELARTHYNRGILRSDQGLADDADFREAIRLLLPLSEASAPASDPIRQELARTYNNLARLLRRNGRAADARQFYEQAIAIHESLAQQRPESRDYQLELATFYNNLAILLEENNQLDLANQRNGQALKLFGSLSQPVPALGLELASARNVRGRILESQGDRAGAQSEYEQSIRTFEDLSGRTDRAEFHLRFGQALFNLAALLRERNDLKGAASALSRAVAEHTAAGARQDLGYDYLLLMEVHLGLNAIADARADAANLLRVLPTLDEPDKKILTEGYEGLQRRLQ